MRLVVVIQARLGSLRLPGKVLLPVAGKPLLERLIARVRAAKTPFEVCVATTFLPADEAIVALCRRLDVPCIAGHPTDLLDRHVAAGRALRADALVKIPSDCPLIDAAAIDRVLGAFLAERDLPDLTTNLCPPSWPDGNDVEVMPIDVLERARVEATRPIEREHTTPFIWLRPERFTIRNVQWETGLDYSRSHRLTIDFPEDYELVKAVYDELEAGEDRIFTLSDILALFARRPELCALNAHHAGNTWQARHVREIEAARAPSCGPSARTS
jgi:spore coat polysaccharide biosynthesis protein SpsF